MTAKPDTTEGTAPARSGGPAPQDLEQIQEALRGLQFGQVTVIVQDGVIVQLERTERRRLHRATRKR